MKSKEAREKVTVITEEIDFLGGTDWSHISFAHETGTDWADQFLGRVVSLVGPLPIRHVSGWVDGSELPITGAVAVVTDSAIIHASLSADRPQNAFQLELEADIFAVPVSSVVSVTALHAAPIPRHDHNDDDDWLKAAKIKVGTESGRTFTLPLTRCADRNPRSNVLELIPFFLERA